MRWQRRKLKAGAEYRILLFKDVEHVPVQLRVTFKKIWLAAVAALSGVVLLLALVGGLILNVRLFKESEAARHQLADSSEQMMQQMQHENEQLKENLKQSEEQLLEIQELQDIVVSMHQKLAEIQQREQEVRSRLGLEEDIAETDMVQSQSLISPHTIPMINQSYLSLQEQLDTMLSDYSGFIDIITKNEQDVKKAADTRKEVVAYALQFLGGTYVYGGNDPYTGVDCSGFTKYILFHAAGITLNRTAARQSEQGKAVTMNQVRPGDLVFYGNGSSYINHVAIYIGDGKVVHASTKKTGIIISRWNYRTPVKIKNVLGQ